MWPCPTPRGQPEHRCRPAFEPMNQAEIHELRVALLDAGPIMCAACDGRCGRAAGTDAPPGRFDPLPDLPRASWRRRPAKPMPSSRRKTKLARSRPRRRPYRLPDQARLRPALAGGRSPARLNRLRFPLLFGFLLETVEQVLEGDLEGVGVLPLLKSPIWGSRLGTEKIAR